VRDIAKIHVKATTEEVAKGQRYLCIAGTSLSPSTLLPSAISSLTSRPSLCIGHFDNQQIAQLGRTAFPSQSSRFPETDSKAAPPHFKTDSSKVEKELGIEFIPFRQSVKDTLEELFKIEERIKKESK